MASLTSLKTLGLCRGLETAPLWGKASLSCHVCQAFSSGELIHVTAAINCTELNMILNLGSWIYEECHLCVDLHILAHIMLKDVITANSEQVTTLQSVEHAGAGA